MPRVVGELDELALVAESEVAAQGIGEDRTETRRYVHLRYDGSDTECKNYEGGCRSNLHQVAK